MKKILLILKANILFVSLFIVLIIIGIGIKVLLKMKQDINKMQNNIKPKYQKLIKYETLKEKAPSPALITKLTKKKEQKEKQFNYFLTKFSTTYPQIPQFKTFPKVEYKEFLLETESSLMKKAKENGVILPVSPVPFGFSEIGFPTSSQIPVLSLQLVVLKSFINILIDAGIEDVNSVIPGTSTTVNFYQILPLNVSIMGTSGEIIRLFDELSLPSSFFILKNFSIVKVKPGLFKSDFTVNAVILKKNKPSAP